MNHSNKSSSRDPCLGTANKLLLQGQALSKPATITPNPYYLYVRRAPCPASQNQSLRNWSVPLLPHKKTRCTATSSHYNARQLSKPFSLFLALQFPSQRLRFTQVVMIYQAATILQVKTPLFTSGAHLSTNSIDKSTRIVNLAMLRASWLTGMLAPTTHLSLFLYFFIVIEDFSIQECFLRPFTFLQ